MPDNELSIQQQNPENLCIENLPDGSTAVFDTVAHAVHSLEPIAAAAFCACRARITLSRLIVVMSRTLKRPITERMALGAIEALEKAGLVVCSQASRPGKDSASRRRSVLRVASGAVPLVISLTSAQQSVFAQRAGSPPSAATGTIPPGIKGYREVFYATDRAPLSGGSFGTDASDSQELNFGRVVVSIPETHQRGEIERPWQVFSFSFPEDASKHIVIAQRSPLEKKAFFSGVTGAIDAAPDKGTFLFVHGYNVSFDDAVLRTAQLAWDMKFLGPALAYSWPSAAAAGKYVSDLDMADWSAPHLARLLQELRSRTGSRTIHLVAHSMGSRVLSMALDRLALMNRKAAGRFQEVVLAAPDINRRVLSQLSAALKAEADRITIYTSSRDLALHASSFLRAAQPRAGADASSQRLTETCDVIDATLAKSSLLGHSYFAEDTLLLNDLALLLKQRLDPDKRSITLERAGPVWVFHR